MKQRLWSLDALRGADMMFIMGLSGLITALCAWAGAPDCALVQQMRHVRWEGLAHHDTIFPLFLFIAGVAWPFSLAAQREKGRTTVQIVRKVLVRALILCVVGFVYNGALKDFGHMRIPSVLARIGLGWAGAALIFMFVRKVWMRALMAGALLVGYWALLSFNVAPDAPAGATAFTDAGNFAGWIDRKLLPGLAIRMSDPEGVLSTMCGVVTAMLGVFSGEIVRSSLSGAKKTLVLLAFAAALALAGWAWLPWCPCIKKLWTPTFALFVGAYSAAVFAVFYWLCDVMMWRKWTFFFRVIGMNSITIYLFQRFVDVRGDSQLLFGGLAKAVGGDAATVILSVGYIAICWLFLYFLYRKNIFLKI